MEENVISPFVFNWQYKDFEIHSVQKRDNKPYVELVKVGERACYTLAVYNWDSDGGRLVFTGNRPFKEIAEIDIQAIWKQLWLACEMLNDWYDKEVDGF